MIPIPGADLLDDSRDRASVLKDFPCVNLLKCIHSGNIFLQELRNKRPSFLCSNLFCTFRISFNDENDDLKLLFMETRVLLTEKWLSRRASESKSRFQGISITWYYLQKMQINSFQDLLGHHFLIPTIQERMNFLRILGCLIAVIITNSRQKRQNVKSFGCIKKDLILVPWRITTCLVVLWLKWKRIIE